MTLTQGIMNKTQVPYGAHANGWCCDYSCHAINIQEVMSGKTCEDCFYA